jgi:hypothetical protein
MSESLSTALVDRPNDTDIHFIPADQTNLYEMRLIQAPAA